MKKISLILLVLAAALFFAGYYFIANRPASGPAELCERTGGRAVNCAKAFFIGCAKPFVVDGTEYACACKDGTAWNATDGCR